MRTKLVVPVLLLGAAMVLTACGSDSSDSGSSGSSSTAGGAAKAKAPVQLSGSVTNKGTKDISADGASTEMDLEADDFYFEPTFIKVAPGQKVKVEVENEGSTAHTFTSTTLGVDQEVQPGSKAEVEITVPQSGNAPFFCRFHRDSGMQGAMFTTAG